MDFLADLTKRFDAHVYGQMRQSDDYEAEQRRKLDQAFVGSQAVRDDFQRRLQKFLGLRGPAQPGIPGVSGDFRPMPEEDEATRSAGRPGPKTWGSFMGIRG